MDQKQHIKDSQDPYKENQLKSTKESFFNNVPQHLPKMEASAVTTKTIKACRICLEEAGGSKKKNEFINPCMCSGSLEQVHEECLISWLNAVAERKQNIGDSFDKLNCEICKDEFKLQWKKSMECRNLKEVKKQIKQYRKVFICVIASIFFVISMMVGFYFLQNFLWPSGVKVEKTDFDAKIAVMVVVWGLLSVYLIIWVYRLLTYFFIKNVTKIMKVFNKKQQHVGQQNKITEAENLRKLGAETTKDKRIPNVTNETMDRMGAQQI